VISFCLVSLSVLSLAVIMRMNSTFIGCNNEIFSTGEFPIGSYM
jgi:hypothetical protein